MPATVYSNEIADKICDLIASTDYSLRKICAADDMPHQSTIFRWLSANEEFRLMYAYAKEAQADLLAEEIIDIIDDTTGDMVETADGLKEYNVNVRRAKIRMEGRKWLASRLRPSKYGNRPDVATMLPRKRQVFIIGDQEIEFP